MKKTLCLAILVLLTACSCKREFYVIKNDDGLYGYMDNTGKVIVEPRFELVGTNGRVGEEPSASFLVKTGWSHKKTYNMFYPPVYTGDCFNTLLPVMNSDLLWGYINSSNGEMAIKPIYHSAGAFFYGLARVMIFNGCTYKCGYIDKKGIMAIQPEFGYGGRFYQWGIAPVLNDGKWGFINRKGKIIVKPQYELICPFFEGRAVVYKPGDICSYVDESGREIGKDFIHAFDFSGGLAVVKVSKKPEEYAYINRKGNIEIGPVQCRFAYGFPCGSDRAMIWRNNGLFGFIDKKGKSIAEGFDVAYEFEKNGLAKVKKSNKWFYIGRDGKAVKKSGGDL
jgi:hypothetical protein